MTGRGKGIIQCEVIWIEEIPTSVNYVINQPIIGTGKSTHFEKSVTLCLIKL